MKYLFSILTIFTMCSVAYAGTGPSSNSVLEEVSFSRVIGTTSTVFTLNMWNTSTISSTNAAYAFIRGDIFNGTTPLSACDPTNSIGSGSGSGWYDGYQFVYPVTTGTVSIFWTASDFNPNITSTPYNIYSNCGTTPSISSSNWTSAYWDLDEINLDTGPSSTAETIIFREPNYGTTPIPDFNYFVLSGYNLNVFNGNINDSSYLIKIVATYASGTAPSTTLQAQTTWFTFSNGTSSEPTITVPNTMTLAPSPIALREWNLTAYLCERTDTDCSSAISSSTSYAAIKTPERLSPTSDEFDIYQPDSPYSAIGGYRSGQYGNYMQEIKYGANNRINIFDYECPSAADWTDVGGGIAYGLCSVGKILFDPMDISLTFISDAFNNLKGVFPFSIFYSLNNSIDGVYRSTPDDLSLNFQFNIANQTSSIPVGGENFLINIFGTSLVSLVFNIILFSFGIGLTTMLWKTVINI